MLESSTENGCITIATFQDMVEQLRSRRGNGKSSCVTGHNYEPKGCVPGRCRSSTSISTVVKTSRTSTSTINSTSISTTLVPVPAPAPV